MGHALYRIAAIDLGIQWACWIVAAKLQTEKFYDFAGAVTHAALVLYSLLESDSNAALSSTRQKVLTGMVLTWCTRLGSFLLNRISATGATSASTGPRPPRALLHLLDVSGGVGVRHRVARVHHQHDRERRASLGARLPRLAMWIAGFAIQVIADAQKRAPRHGPGSLSARGSGGARSTPTTLAKCSCGGNLPAARFSGAPSGCRCPARW